MRRGDVHQVRRTGQGREQHGRRYAVILQADELLGLSTVLVAPTSRSALPATFRPEIEIAGETTRVLVEQTRAVDAERLGPTVGHLAHRELQAVDAALELVLDL